MAKKFTIPKLKSYPLESGKDWYVWFRYEGGNPIRISEGINKIHDYNERILEGNALARVLRVKLENGWNPVKPKSKLPSATDFSYNFIDAYNFALQELYKLGKSKSSHFAWNTHHKQAIAAVKSLDFQDENIKDFEPFHITLILEEMCRLNKNTANYYNTHIEGFVRFFNMLKEKFIVKSNPAIGIPTKKHIPEEKRLLTEEEYKAVFAHFSVKKPLFVLFMKMVEIGIRPKEIRFTKVGMIQKHFFDLPAEITKTEKRRLVPITSEIQMILDGMDLSNPDYFLIGKGFQTHPVSLGRNSAANLWKNEVKDFLKIDSELYWLKSRYANILREKGVPLDIIKDLYGHSDEDITKVYATEDYQIRMREVMDFINKKIPTK